MRILLRRFALMAALVASTACRHDVTQEAQVPPVAARPDPAPPTMQDAPRRAEPTVEVPAGSPKVVAPSGPPEVVARVLGPDGAPVVGAGVFVRRSGLDPESETKTDAAGKAWLPGPRTAYWYARAEASGLMSPWGHVQHANLWPDVDLRLVETAALHGVVVDAKSGEPVPDAAVDVMQGGAVTETWTESIGPPLATVPTDAQGRFGSVNVPRGIVVTVRARASGRPRAERRVLVPVRGEPEPALLRLESGGVVSTRVRLPDGSPAVGAHVWVSEWTSVDPDDEPGGKLRSDIRWRVAGPGLGAEGAFREEGLRLGARYRVTAGAKGWADSSSVAVLLTEDAPTAEVAPALRRPAALEVLVLDPEGRPVGDAEIVEGRDWNSLDLIQNIPLSGVAGRYRQDGLSLGAFIIEVHAPGFAPARQTLRLEEGRTHEATVRLERTVSIRGKVVDERRQGASDVSVRASAVEYAHFVIDENRGSVRSAADGSFEIPGLAPGRYELHASSAEYETPKSAEHVVVSAPGEGAVIALVRCGGARFRLVAPTGIAAPRDVDMRPYADNGAVGPGKKGDGFEIRYLAPGERKFRLFPRGFAEVELAFRIAPGETTDLGDIPLDLGAKIRARVVDAQGRPVSHAVVVLVQRMSQGDPRTTCDDDGVFTLDHLAHGGNDLDLRREGFLVERVFVLGDVPPSTIVLHRGGLLRVHVVDAAGAGSSSLVEAVRSDPAVEETKPENIYTDERGRGEQRLAAGRYALRLQGKPARDVEIVEGGELDVRLTRP